jgi:small-conductance mechanosensitive channel
LQRRYFLNEPKVEPRVYWRMTDNGVELKLRFLAPDRGVRDIKDRMTREILERFRAEGIQIASTSLDIVGLPPLRFANAAAQLAASA